MPFSTEHHRGFTLIEVMVVVTIIGIMIGVVTINVITTDPQKKLNKEALRLQVLIEMLQEEALFSQNEFGIVVDEGSYRFARWEEPVSTSQEEQDAPGLSSTPAPTQSPLGTAANIDKPDPEWVWFNSENTFRDYELDENFEIILEVDQEQIDLTGGVDPNNPKAKDASKILTDEEDEIKPSIFVMSSGEISPFVIELFLIDDVDIRVKLSADETGRMWVGDPEEDEDDGNF